MTGKSESPGSSRRLYSIPFVALRYLTHISVDSDGSGSIDRQEFLQIPQIANNPLAGRMIAIFDEEYVSLVFLTACAINDEADPIPTLICSGGGTVDFQEFVGGLSAFSSRGGREEKLRCMSSLYFTTFFNLETELISHSRIQSV